MRRDMAKKLCERPRIDDGWGGPDGYVRSRQKIRVQDLVVHEDEDGNEVLDTDEGRPTMPMSRGRGSKILGENLQPLFRFLESKVGKPWDKVYSEIREHVRVDSATQLHILQHMEHYVSGLADSNLEEENGRIYEIGSYFRERVELRQGELFIHPRTKLLMKYKKNPRGRLYNKRNRPKEGDVIKINDFTYYAKIEGIWHEVVYDQKWGHENNKWAFPGKFYDTKLVGHPNAFSWGNQLEYEKRTLPKSILKQMGLKNAKA